MSSVRKWQAGQSTAHHLLCRPRRSQLGSDGSERTLFRLHRAVFSDAESNGRFDLSSLLGEHGFREYVESEDGIRFPGSLRSVAGAAVCGTSGYAYVDRSGLWGVLILESDGSLVLTHGDSADMRSEREDDLGYRGAFHVGCGSGFKSVGLKLTMKKCPPHGAQFRNKSLIS